MLQLRSNLGAKSNSARQTTYPEPFLRKLDFYQFLGDQWDFERY